jgi:hypothetical protein
MFYHAYAMFLDSKAARRTRVGWNGVTVLILPSNDQPVYLASCLKQSSYLGVKIDTLTVAGSLTQPCL